MVPYVVQWEKRGSDTPIFIWYDNYPTHCSDAFVDKATNHCRIAKVDPGNKKGLGAASLNLTNIQETDRGWYNCKVVLLNREPEHKVRSHLCTNSSNKVLFYKSRVNRLNIFYLDFEICD